MSFVDEMAQQKLAELEALAKDQEREMLEEKRQYEEAEGRLAETRRQMAELRTHLASPAEAKTTRAKKST